MQRKTKESYVVGTNFTMTEKYSFGSHNNNNAYNTAFLVLFSLAYTIQE